MPLNTHWTTPREVFAAWPLAQLEVDRHARETPCPPRVLRTTGFLRPDVAERVTGWFTAPETAVTAAVKRSYDALERETARLFELIRRDLDIRVRTIHSDTDPYGSAAELCAELREHRSMTLTHDEPHPLLARETVDRLRVVHDVYGHAALGLGFDLQSEYATWLQCRTLFSPAARPAAFCELVGAVTAYILNGEKPGLRAKLPPAGLNC